MMDEGGIGLHIMLRVQVAPCTRAVNVREHDTMVKE